jgi:hypothetical protein
MVMPEAEYRRQETGDRIQETEYRRQNTGDTGDRIQESECRILPPMTFLS